MINQIALLLKSIHKRCTNKKDSNKIYEYLKKDTVDEPGDEFKSTREIASYTNLTEDRVRFLCSRDSRIFLSTGENPDFWGIYRRTERSIFEKRGPIALK